MNPLEAEIVKVRKKVEESADPSKLFQPLKAPFDKIVETAEGLDPLSIIRPIQERLTEGIKTITGKIPLDIADGIFDVVKNIGNEIQQVVEEGSKFRNGLEAINKAVCWFKQC